MTSALQLLTVKIAGDISGALKGFDAVITASKQLGKDMQKVGAVLTAGVTLPLVALGTSATRSAIEFESSFAGIRKTMDLTEEEFDRLAKANRDLAKEIPVTADELNRLGELAGQLGIKGVDNVVKFEDTIAKLTVTTDLAAEEAALAFAQIANVTKLPQGQIDRLGSVVVGLGNNFATTESRIVDFTQRLSGAGAVAGLSVADIAGIGTAFASIGVEAEAGGTAVQKVLLGMLAAVSQGGPELARFAEASDMTAAEFQRAFREDAAGAFSAFVAGLSRQGDQAIGTLEALGLTDQRLTRAFLGMAGASDVLTDAIATANEEFARNTALSDEAEQRFATTESRLQTLRNRFHDAAITIGTALLPAVLSVIEATEPLVEWVSRAAEGFATLDPTIQTVVITLGAAAAAAGPVLVAVGSLLIALPALSTAFAGLWTAMTGPVGLIAAAAAGLGILGTAFLANRGAAKNATQAMDEYRSSLIGLGLEELRQRQVALNEEIAGYEARLRGATDRIIAANPALREQAEKLATARAQLSAVSEAGREMIGRQIELRAATEDASAASAAAIASMAAAAKETEAQITESMKNIGAAHRALVPSVTAAGERLGLLTDEAKAARDAYIAEQKELERKQNLFVTLGGTLEKVTVPAMKQMTFQVDEFAWATRLASEAVWDFADLTAMTARRGTDAFVDFAFGAKNAMRDFVDSALRDLARLAASKFLKLALNVVTGGSSGFLGGLFAGFFADGGFIQPGQYGIVGERGPEVVFGGRSGVSVTPTTGAQSVRGGAGGGGVSAASIAANILSRVGPPPSFASPEVAALDSYYRRLFSAAFADARLRGAI